LRTKGHGVCFIFVCYSVISVVWLLASYSCGAPRLCHHVTPYIYIYKLSRFLWDMTIHITKSLGTSSDHVIFEVFTVVSINNVVFWDVTPCDSCKKRRFGGAYRIHHHLLFLRLLPRLLVTATFILRSPIFVILMMVVTCSSETWVLIRAARRNIPGDGILHLLTSFMNNTIVYG
jgi:hypothetical protein